MARRVSAGRGGLENLPNIFASLALLGNLDSDQEGQLAPQDLAGTSQEPMDYNDVVETPQYTDVRQNQPPQPDDYIENLRKIANLPLAMSDDNELRQDALENMRPSVATLPPGIQEEQLEGLSGEMGAQQAAQREAPTSMSFDTGMLPRTKSGQLQDPLEFLRQRVEEDPSLLESLPEETRQRLAETTPDAERAFVPETRQPEQNALPAPATQPGEEQQAPKLPLVPPEKPISEGMVEEYPDQKMEPGAVEAGFKDQQIVDDLANLAGGLIPQEQQERAAQWQNVYTKRMEELNAEEKQLLQKAESGQLSTFDKVALGIAIAVPILIALRYGGTAGLLSAGEGLKGFAASYMQQQKQQGEQKAANKKRVEEIGKERLQLEEKDIDVNKKIMDSIEDKQARKFLRNKKFRQFGDNIGIGTGDEGQALWLDANKFDASDDGIKRAREVVKDADETIGIMRDSNKTLNEVLEILDQLPKNTGMWEAVKKNARWFTTAGGANPFGGDAPKIKMKGADGKMHDVDAFALLKQKINVLQDLYNKQVLGGTRLTGNVVTHWGGILGDPSSISDWLSQDLNSFKDTTESLKNIMNSREVESLVGKGFLRAPLERQFPSYQNEVVESPDNRFDRLRASNKDELRKKVK